jgi:molecular chaperone DnaK
MKGEAEAHAVEDAKKREQIEHKNMAETMIYTAEKMLKDAGDKVSSEEKKEIEEKIEALKKIKDGDDHEAIKKAADELTGVAQKIATKLYQKNQGTGDGGERNGGQSEANEKKPDDGPIDAEFKEKKDE